MQSRRRNSNMSATGSENTTIKAEITNVIDGNSIPQSAWDSLVACGNTDTPFQNRYWLQSWLRTVGANEKPFFIKLTDGELIVGIVPLVIAASSVGPLKFRMLQFAGQPHADYGDFLLGENKTACLQALLAFILDHAHLWDVAAFEHLCETSPNLVAFREVLQAAAVPHDVAAHGVLPYVEIGSSFDDYWRGRSRKMRQEIASKGRRLEQLGNVTFKRYQSCEAPQYLASFSAMLKAGYSSKDRLDSDETFEQEQRFVAALMEDEKFASHIHFASLNLDGTPVAYHFGFVDNRAYYGYKTCYSPQYARCSPGMLMIKELMLECERSGIGTIDFLLGNESYKYHWADAERKSFNIRVFHNGWKSRLLYLWLAGIRPRLKENGMLVALVKMARRIRSKAKHRSA